MFADELGRLKSVPSVAILKEAIRKVVNKGDGKN